MVVLLPFYFRHIELILLIVTYVKYDIQCSYEFFSNFQTWLFGYELPDTITVLTESSMCFLASKKKIEFLRQIENGKEESELPPVKLLIRDRVS